MDHPGAKHTPVVQQEAATSILEPCDVKVTMKSTATVEDLNLDVSALQLRMSPDVMQLVMHLQQVRSSWLAVLVRTAEYPYAAETPPSFWCACRNSLCAVGPLLTTCAGIQLDDTGPASTHLLLFSVCFAVPPVRLCWSRWLCPLQGSPLPVCSALAGCGAAMKHAKVLQLQ